MEHPAPNVSEPVWIIPHFPEIPVRKKQSWPKYFPDEEFCLSVRAEDSDDPDYSPLDSEEDPEHVHLGWTTLALWQKAN